MNWLKQLWGWLMCKMDVSHDLVEVPAVHWASELFAAALYEVRTEPAEDKDGKPQITAFILTCSRCGVKIANFEARERGWKIRRYEKPE